MPVRRVDVSSWSAIRADDKPVYLSNEGALKTGKSLKGHLVDIAESLGIFKNYITGYRVREALRNHGAYEAAWEFVASKYGVSVHRNTQDAMACSGYSRASPHSLHFRGRNVDNQQRVIAGRELRMILDTAHALNEYQANGAQQQDAGTAVQNDAQVAAQSGTEAMDIVASESPGNEAQGEQQDVTIRHNPESHEEPGDQVTGGIADGTAESLRDREVAEAGAPGHQAGEVESKPAQISRELSRAMVAGNKKLLRQVLGDKSQLKRLAEELGHDADAIASRQTYIQAKLAKRVEADSRANSRKLTLDEIHELVNSVFLKALGKSPAGADIRGAILNVTSQVKRVLGEDGPADQVDILELSKDRIKAAARDKSYLKRLMVERLDVQDKDISIAATRMKYIEHCAIEEATVMVRKAKVELSSVDVDEVLTRALRRSSEVGESRAWLGGVLGKAGRRVNPPHYAYKRSVDDVLEKAADEQAKALHEVQEVQRQPEQTSSPPVKEPVTSPPQRQDSPQPAAEATSSPASLRRRASLPKPQKHKGMDYFNQSAKGGILELAIPIRNHQAAKQVAADDTYLEASIPEGHSKNELTPMHREYIKTTLLRHVAEHERTKPNILLKAEDLHLMMKPITARALTIQSGRKLGAKVLYKKVTKHLGRQDAAFSNELRKHQRDARSKAGLKCCEERFVRSAADKAGIDINVDSRVLRAIRPQVKDMAEAYVGGNRKVLTDSALETIVQVVLEGYNSPADRLKRLS